MIYVMLTAESDIKKTQYLFDTEEFISKLSCKAQERKVLT
jgi:hypothetical protein